MDFVHIDPLAINESLFQKSLIHSILYCYPLSQRTLGLKDIARLHNPILRGWIAYYGAFSPSSLYPVFRHFNVTLVAWAMRKYRRLKGHKTRAMLFLENIAKRQPDLFAHWKKGMVGGFA